VLVALPTLQWVIDHSSWRWAYGTLGIVGLVWSAVWLLVGREGTLPVAIKAESGDAIERLPYSSLIFNQTVIANFIAGFGAYWGLSVVLAWFNPFLITVLGMDPTAASFIAAFPWVIGMFFVIAIGWLSQVLVAKGLSSRVARGMLGGSCIVLGGISLILMPNAGPNWLKIAMIAAGISMPAVIYVMGQAVISEITPVSQRGAMLAINTAIYTSAGLLAPYVMGIAVENAATQAEGYLNGFVICGVITLITGAVAMAFIRPGDEVRRFSSQMPSAKPAPAE
jgi:MFS family permease